MQWSWPQHPLLADSLLPAGDADCPADPPQSCARVSGCHAAMEDTVWVTCALRVACWPPLYYCFWIRFIKPGQLVSVKYPQSRQFLTSTVLGIICSFFLFFTNKHSAGHQKNPKIYRINYIDLCSYPQVSKYQGLFSVCVFVIALEIFVSILAFCFPDLYVKRVLAQIPYCSAPLYNCFLNCFFVLKYLYCDTLVKMCTENKP